MNEIKLSEMEQLIQAKYSNIAGITIHQNGELLYENYYNGCTKVSTIHLYSVTKSIFSILVGIAIDRGEITSIDRKVLDFFPEYKVKSGEKTIQTITIRDILTMTAPYKYRDGFFAYMKYFTSKDKLKYSLDMLGGKPKNGTFRYAGIIGPDILSGIIMKTTRKNVYEYAKENLFEPLGINVACSQMFKSSKEYNTFINATDMSGWAADDNGVNSAGWGLSLTSSDLAKIGDLYLNHGVYNGCQIVSKEWVDESTTEHSRWAQENLPYGYLWWLHDTGFAAMGDGGNIIYVNRENGMVVAITAKFRKNVFDRIEFIKNNVEPIFTN